MLLPLAGSLAAADERLAGRLGRERLEAIAALVPEEWLEGEPAQRRAAHVDYLAARLAAPRDFVEEADRARLAVPA